MVANFNQKRGFGKQETAVALSELARIPMPQAVEDEYGVLGCIFNSQDALGTFLKILPILKPEHFITPDLQEIWLNLVTAHNTQLPVDFRVFANYLQDFCRKSPAQIKTLLERMCGSLHDEENVEFYADRIVSKWKSRELVGALSQGTKAALDSAVDPEDALAIAERQIAAVRETITRGKKKKSGFVGDILKEVLDNAEAIAKGERKSSTVRTNDFYDFDQAANGFAPGEIWIIAAPPSCGKTTTAANLGRSLARNGVFTLLISLEMNEAQVASKVLAAEAKLPACDLTRNPNFTLEEIRQLRERQQDIAHNLKLSIRKPSDITIQGVERIIAEEEAKFREKYGDEFTGFRVVLLDYIQYFGEFVSSQEKTAVISQATVRLGEVCRSMGATLVAFAQLDTDTVKSGKAPKDIYCLRDCKAIANHADQLIVIHAEGSGDRQNMHSKGIIEFIWLKNREGGNSSVKMGINWELAWIYPLASSYNTPCYPSSSPRKVQQVDPAIIAKYASEDDDILPPLEVPELALAVPKGADVEQPEQEPLQPQLELTEASDRVPESAEVCVGAEAVEDVSSTEVLQEEQTEPAQDGSIEINGEIYRIGELAKAEIISGKFIQVEILGYDANGKFVCCKALETIPHTRRKGEDLFPVGRVFNDMHPCRFSKL